jgi:thiamine kinase-like enzyme
LQLESLRSHLANRFPSWVGFCHNDLQYGNMLLFRHAEADGGVVGTAESGSIVANGSSDAAVPAAALEAVAAVTAAAAAAAEGAASKAAGAPVAQDDPAGQPAAEAGSVAANGSQDGHQTAVKLIDYEYSTLNECVGRDFYCVVWQSWHGL